MAKVVHLHNRLSSGSTAANVARIKTFRLVTGMDPAEFARAISVEMGWPIPFFVYTQWESDSDLAAPTDVLQAARKISVQSPIGSRPTSASRRTFLGGVAGAAAAFAAAGPITQLGAAPLEFGGHGPKSRISAATASDLETMVGSYRRAYGGRAGVDDLLPSASALLGFLTELSRRGQWRGDHERLASLIGQTSLLAGLLNLMGPKDLDAAAAHYATALQAANEAEDWDLAAYALGSLAFHASTSQRTDEARAFRDSAMDLAARRASPRTRAWAAALGSELFAKEGDEVASQRALATGFAAIERVSASPDWKGVGWFDEARLVAYEGGNMVLLGRYPRAEGLLRQSLEAIDPLRLKHRSTLSADLATALAHQEKVEEACELAMDALTFARTIAHEESIDRVRKVHFKLLRWRSHAAVRLLTERLQVA